MIKVFKQYNPKKLKVGDIVIVHQDYHPSRWEDSGTDHDRTARIVTFNSEGQSGLEFLYRPTNYSHNCHGHGKEDWCMWLNSIHFIKVAVEDEPEETNYEQWNESLNPEDYQYFNYSIGDRIKFSNNRSDYNGHLYVYEFRGKKGTIVGLLRGLKIHNNNNYLIQFDEPTKNTFTTNSPGYRVFTGTLVNKDFRYEGIEGYAANLKWLTTTQESIIKLVDDSEETNYEEWVEESNVINTIKSFSELKRGDIIKLVNLSDGNPWNNQLARVETVSDDATGFRRISDDRFGSTTRTSNIELIGDEPEETNYEQWNESNGFGFEVGDMVKVNIGGTHGADTTYGWIGKIIEMVGPVLIVRFDNPIPSRPDPSKYVIKNTEYANNMNVWNYAKQHVELYEDKPEDTNYEQWVEESKIDRFKIGDKVKMNPKKAGLSQLPVWYSDEIYTVVSISTVYNDCVVLDRNIPGHTSAVIHIDYLDIYDDSPEDTNYEQWNESLNHNRINEGDYLMCINNHYDPSLEVGKKYKVLKIKEALPENPGVFRIWIDHNLTKSSKMRFDANSPYSEQFKIIDTPEDSNYEEWIEESVHHNFKRGDKVIYTDSPGYGISYHWGRLYLVKGQTYTVRSVETRGDKSVCISLKENPGRNKNGQGGYFIFSEDQFKLVDDKPEETNYEEWNESVVNERKYRVGQKVLIADKIDWDSFDDDTDIEELKKFKKKGSIGQITEYLENTNDNEHDTYVVEFPNGYVFFLYSYELTPVDDGPEETNYEEWVEESSGHGDKGNLKIGDIVEVIETSDTMSTEKILTGKIGRIVEFFPEGVYVEFLHDELESIPKIHNLAYLPDNPNKKLWTPYFNMVKKVNDEPEDTNYEQWLEESNKIREYEVGDIIRIRKDCNTDNTGPYKWGYGMDQYLGKISRITDKKWDDTHDIMEYYLDFEGSKNHYWSSHMFEPYDDSPEETNYEKWNEKIITKYEEF